MASPDLPSWLRYLPDIVEKIRARYFLAAAVVLTGVLLLPPSLAKPLGMDQLPPNWRLTIAVVMLLTLGVWLAKVAPILISTIQRRRTESDALEHLDSLSRAERFILTFCLHRHARTVQMNSWDPIAGSLCGKGLLSMGSPVHTQQVAYPFTIPSFVWRHLTSHRGEWLKQAETEYEPLDLRASWFEQCVASEDPDIQWQERVLC